MSWHFRFLSSEEHVKLVRIPRGVEDLRLIHEVVEKYSEDNATFTLISFCYLYVFMQSFAIPGPVFLSILSGAIFGGVKGFFIVCFVSQIIPFTTYLNLKLTFSMSSSTRSVRQSEPAAAMVSLTRLVEVLCLVSSPRCWRSSTQRFKITENTRSSICYSSDLLLSCQTGLSTLPHRS